MVLSEAQFVSHIVDVEKVVVLTGKGQKVESVRRTLSHRGITAQVEMAPLHLTRDYVEPRYNSPTATALDKAEYGQRMHHSLNPTLQREKVAHIGLDGLFYNGESWFHKPENQDKQTIERVRAELHGLLSWKNDPPTPFAWALAISSWNGASASFEQIIALRTSSIDPRVIDNALDDVIQEGVLTSFNTRIRLFETLRMCGAINQIAIASTFRELLWSKDLAKDKDALNQVEAAIHGTNPLEVSHLQPARANH